MSFEPHGGALINRYNPPMEERTAITIEMDQMALSDLECLSVGAYSPLTGFMNQSDYESVLKKMHLANGCVWTIPIVFPITQKTAEKIKKEEMITLAFRGVSYANMIVDEIYCPDKEKEAI